MKQYYRVGIRLMPPYSEQKIVPYVVPAETAEAAAEAATYTASINHPDAEQVAVASVTAVSGEENRLLNAQMTLFRGVS